MDIEMFLGTGHRQAAGCVRCKVAEMPSLDETTKSGNSRVLFQGAQRSNAKLAVVLQFDALGLFGLLFIHRFKQLVQFQMLLLDVVLPHYYFVNQCVDVVSRISFLTLPYHSLAFLESQKRKRPAALLFFCAFV